MGVNFLIKRIIFEKLSVFRNGELVPLNEYEIKQIAGRAGRYVFFV